jgi:hypothetical protein
MKKVGEPSRGGDMDTQNVQELGLRDAVLVGQLIEAGAALEGRDHRLDSNAPWAKIGTPKARSWSTTTSACPYFGRWMIWAHWSPSKSTRCLIGVDDLVEDPLVVAHHDELARTPRLRSVTLMLGVVPQNLCTVGEQLAGSQHMLDAELVTEAIQRWPDSL